MIAVRKKDKITMDEKKLKKFKIGLNFEIIIFLIGILFAGYKNSIFFITVCAFIVIGDIIAIFLIDKQLKK